MLSGTGRASSVHQENTGSCHTLPDLCQQFFSHLRRVGGLFDLNSKFGREIPDEFDTLGVLIA